MRTRTGRARLGATAKRACPAASNANAQPSGRPRPRGRRWARTTDELIAAAGREDDAEKRFAYFREAEKILVTDEMPICPLYYYVGIQFYDPKKLGGVEANLLDEHPLKAMYWKKR